MGNNQSAQIKDTVIVSAPVYHTENFVVSVATLSVISVVGFACAALYLYKKCKQNLVREVRSSVDIA